MRDNAKSIVTQNAQDASQSTHITIHNYTEYVQKHLSDISQEHIMLAVVIVIGISAWRLYVMRKIDRAEDKSKISENDKSKYLSEDSSKPVNNTADAGNNTADAGNNITGSHVEGTNILNNNILGGNNPQEDYANILKQYISDLYDDLTSGDDILREAGLDWLVDNNKIPSVDEVVEILTSYFSNF